MYIQNSMSIVLDTREHGLIGLFPDTPTHQLSVGDCWIKVQNQDSPVLVIERKTTSDFEASFLDGRYREQRTRLLAYCAEHKAKALYILEGGLDGRRRSMERSALQKLVNRLVLRYSVAVVYTKSLEDTASTLNLIASQIAEDPKVFEGEQLSYTDVIHTTKKANKDDQKAFACGALQGCPGVSAKSATAIWDATGSWQKLLDMDEKALAELKIGERRLGPAVAKRLWNLFHL